MGLRRVAWVLFAAAAAGCHAPPPVCDQACVSREVEARFGKPLAPPVPTDKLAVPPGFDPGRPLAEDQAVLLALWNNPAFHELLTELHLTRADLVQAGLLPNPEFVYYWPEVNKPMKYLIDLPIEAVWLRPVRLKAAAAENERACGRVTQAALDLIRDTRQAYADLQLARDRVTVAAEAVALRGRISDLAAARVRAGESGEQEAATARIDALSAKQDATRAGFDVTAAAERLKLLTGLSGFPEVLSTEPQPDAPPTQAFDPEALVREAVRTRPDAAAAEAAEKAALERLRLARLGWVRFLGILDATSGRGTGHEFGPALRMTVPLFNRNQGGIARAEAEVEQLTRRRLTVHAQIILDVRLSHTRYRQAAAELEVLRNTLRPEVEASVRRAELAFRNGNATYLLVLEATRQLIDTYAREAQLRADLRRARAELERAVGRRLPADPPGEGAGP